LNEKEFLASHPAGKYNITNLLGETIDSQEEAEVPADGTI
jgi:hypothetical protein